MAHLGPVIEKVSASPLERRLLRVSAPFRGYGIERIPGLRGAYRRAYSSFLVSGVKEVTTDGGTLRVDTSDMSIVPSLRFTGWYEQRFSIALSHLVAPGMRTVDVGAHVGYHTLRMARRVGPTGRVLAFEPITENFELLAANIRLNHMDAVTVASPLALSDRPGSANVWTDATNSGGASLVRACVGSPKLEAAVRTQTLDNALMELFDESAPSADLLKIDVQGLEGSVLQGADQLLTRARPIVAFEFNPHQLTLAGQDPQELLDHLADRSFNLYACVEHDGTVRTVTPALAEAWCRADGADGTGFLNLVALPDEKDGWTLLR